MGELDAPCVVNMMRYSKLFEPVKIGNLELKNRVVMPPMTTNFAKDGKVTDSTVDYYTERARGGVGLIVIEDAIVDSPVGNHTYDCLTIDDDKYLPGLCSLAREVRNAGAKVLLNLNHGGRRAGRVENGQLLVTRGHLPVAPSSLPHPVTGFVVPHELSIEEIKEIEDKFVKAACRTREAGFDGVSLHAAHMYLISEFISPLSNKRKDIYGGSIDGRIRFLVEIVRKIKSELGNGYPIMVRINGREGMEGGITTEDAKYIALTLEKAGIDCISLSCGAGIMIAEPDFPTPVAPARLPHCLDVHLSEAVKQVVTIPVMTANRIVTPQEAEEILEQEKADLIGIGRGLIADPQWPNKANDGLESEIRCCIGCMHCLKTVLEEREEMCCTVNAATGREGKCTIIPVKKSKIIFVAGGGIAGMEAARVAACRGNKVILYEKDKLGGQVNLSSVLPGKKDFKYIIDFQANQLNKHGVKIKYKELTVEEIKYKKPDTVIVATGAQPIAPLLPGAKNKNVVTAWAVLNGQIITGSKVVILGGGEVGAEIAECLASKGKRVTIVEMREGIAMDMDRTTRIFLISSLSSLGVEFLTKSTAKEIKKKGVIIDDRGKERFIQADLVVLALGAKSNFDLACQVKKMGINYHIVGDCVEARRMPEAISEGFFEGGLKA